MNGNIVFMDATAGEETEIPSMKKQFEIENVDNTADSAKNVLSATKLTTARNITVMGCTRSFDGSSDISFNSTDMGTVSLDDIKKLISDSNTFLMQKLYPVGSVKLTFVDINPGTIIPNTTWVLESKGAYLRGINPDDANLNSIKTGGSNTIDLSHNHGIAAHTHTLNHTHTIAAHAHTIAHAHSINGHSHTVNSHAHSTGGLAITANQMPAHSHSVTWNNGNNSITGGGGIKSGTKNAEIACYSDNYIAGKTFTINNTGGGAAHAHGNTGASSPATNAVALNTNSGGGNSGSTALTTASGGGTTSGTALTTETWAPTRSVEPVYQTVYVWKRTA